MKYIRTKDGIWEVSSFKGMRTIRNKQCEYVLYQDTDVIAQADTIEELCDEFMIFNSNNTCIGIIDHYETAKYKSPYKAIVYGAIWTDKGLIYVAKMNDKGELELL